MNSLVPSIYAFTRRNKDKIILTKIIEDYLRETQEEIEILKANNCQVITEFESCLNQFTSLVKLAFDNDVNNRFASSIERARIVGVPEHKILHNKHETDDFFTNNEPIDL